ncbi:MAG TPA: hypothetical protein DD456_06460, partial [Stenotrophomonas sp.]|nr:hypothetical protein [Stenotrophomonas sp.]
MRHGTAAGPHLLKLELQPNVDVPGRCALPPGSHRRPDPPRPGQPAHPRLARDPAARRRAPAAAA